MGFYDGAAGISYYCICFIVCHGIPYEKKLVCETDMMPSGLNLWVSIVFVLKSAPLTNKEDCWVVHTIMYSLLYFADTNIY